MSDTLSRLIEGEVGARVALIVATPPVTYGVWLRGKGWLRNERSRKPFADLRIEHANAAAQLIGQSAVVLPVDDALDELESVFLERERQDAAQRKTARLARWLASWLGWTKLQSSMDNR